LTDYPFDEVVKAADECIARGGKVFQKFTCGNCGNRLTMEDADKFYTEGTCDKCGHTTDIVAAGCNYLVVYDLKE